MVLIGPHVIISIALVLITYISGSDLGVSEIPSGSNLFPKISK